MPELPEVEALALDLKGRLDGHAIAKVHLAAFSALKTFDPPVQALEGTLVDDVSRHGKFIDIEMLNFPGGRERSAEEFRALFAAAGFEMTKVVPTKSALSVVEAVRK